MNELLTASERLERAAAAKLKAASPAGNSVVEKSRAAAAVALAKADEAEANLSAAISQIERRILEICTQGRRLDTLRNLEAAVAPQSLADFGDTILEQYISGELGDPYATTRCVNSAVRLAWLKSVTPHIPAGIQKIENAIAAEKAAIKKTAKEHSIRVAELVRSMIDDERRKRAGSILLSQLEALNWVDEA
ncbi:MAG: hypothetical protein ACTHLW_01080 [Verrucomicrobiota bacterium]